MQTLLGSPAVVSLSEFYQNSVSVYYILKNTENKDDKKN